MLSCLFQDGPPLPIRQSESSESSVSLSLLSCPCLWNFELSCFSFPPEISCEYQLPSRNHICQGPHHLDSQRHEGFRVPQVSSLFL